MSSSNGRDSGCPVAFSLDAIGDKWSLLIIRDMLVNDASTYGDFIGARESIATNILANRLKNLVESGIIVKQKDNKNRRINRYYLTQKGRELAPIVHSLMDWGFKYDPKTKATPQVFKHVTAILQTETK